MARSYSQRMHAGLIALACLSVPVLSATPLLLDEIVENVLLEHPRANMATETLQQSKAGTWITGSAMLPRATFSSTWTRYEDIGVPTLSPYQVDDETQRHSLILSQPLFAGGSLWLKGLAALKQGSAAKESYSLELASLAFDTRSAFVDYLVAEEAWNAAEASQLFAGRQLDRSVEQEALGMVSSLDRLFFANAKSQADIAMEGATIARLSARLTLETFLLRPVTREESNQSLDALIDNLETVETELDQLPAMKMSKLNAKAMHLTALASDVRQLPSVSAQMSFSNVMSDPFTYDSRYTDRSIGLSLNWPLFRSGEGLASSWAAHAASRQAKAQSENTKNSLGSQIEILSLQAESSLRQLDLTRTALLLAKENREWLEEKHRLGMSSATDLLLAERDLQLAESALLKAQASRLKSVWALWSMMGRVY
jgi:outer membrane protein TolC